MLTSTQLLLIPTLFSVLLFAMGNEGLEANTTENIAEDLRDTIKERVPFTSQADFNLDKEMQETSNHNASNSSRMDPSNESPETTDSGGNLTTDFSWSPRTTPLVSESSPSSHSVVPKLLQNSSVTDENSLSLSEPPNTTSAVPSEKFPWSLANDTVKTDNGSITVSILPSAPATTWANSRTTEPDAWLSTTSDSIAAFTPYQEMTLQPTLNFTNNSKIFPNTSDPQEENRNTGVVFGAILGAILGASLLTLVGYLLCGKRKTSSFSHRRLYDDRNEPAGRENARDGIPMDDIPPLRTSM
ncbi:mucin-15 isoform X2 [Phyllostomus hastatus]|uniref:mucin-15 isoform X2 n=1 Tax=Phyllostomus hastatus TaxID=9423 RepID=UPI001E67EE6E|nr:mucin-15 isoform X2 [Phyllostomus hastatus]